MTESTSPGTKSRISSRAVRYSVGLLIFLALLTVSNELGVIIPTIICVIVVVGMVIDEPQRRRRLPSIIVISTLAFSGCFELFRVASAKLVWRSAYTRGVADAKKHLADGSFQQFAHRHYHQIRWGSNRSQSPIKASRFRGYRTGLRETLPEGAGEESTARDDFASLGLKKVVNFRQVKCVYLTGPEVTDRHVEWLPIMPNLEGICIQDAPNVTNRALQSLRHVPKLSDLKIYGTQISEDSLKQFELLPRSQRLRIRTRKFDYGPHSSFEFEIARSGDLNGSWFRKAQVQ